MQVTSSKLIENSSILQETSYTKIQTVLNRVNSLTHRLSQNEYPKKHSIQPKLTSKKQALLFTQLTTFFLMIAMHTNLGDYRFILYRSICCLMGLSFSFLFPLMLTSSLKKHFYLFYSVRILSSSIIYSFFYKLELNYTFHIKSLEYDLLVGTFYFILLSLFHHDNLNQLKLYVAIDKLLGLLLNVVLQIYYQSFEVSSYIYQAALILFLCTVYYLAIQKDKLEKMTNQLNVNSYCGEILEELKEIKNNLKEEESTLLHATAPTTSVADDVLTKIKYFKFKLLQEEKERRFLNPKNNVAAGSSKVYRVATASTLSADKRDPLHLSFSHQRKSSFDTQDVSDNNENGSYNSYNDTGDDMVVGDKWSLSAKDCDTLIKMMVEKQTNMYYPDVLKETNSSQLNHETAEFLKQHFTEMSNNLLSPEKKYQKNKTPKLEPTVFAFSPWNEYLEANVCSWNFDMLKFKELTHGRHLPEFGSAIMKKIQVMSSYDLKSKFFNSILKTLDISPNVAGNFLKDVNDGYIPNPYHNSIHGADVANSIGYFCTQPEFRDTFNDLEISCMVISALVHDVGHPGFNNAFLVATKSTEALLYNDQSVLENLHTAYFFKITQKPCSNILQNLSEKDYKYFRKLAIAIILDTDHEAFCDSDKIQRNC